MKLTFAQTQVKELVHVSECRRISQVSQQLVEIRWDWLCLQLRTIDLTVLCGELSHCLDSLSIEQNEDYLLTINGLRLHMSRAELLEFYSMVFAATEQLPYYVVRWKEVTASISPYEPKLVNESGHLNCAGITSSN